MYPMNEQTSDILDRVRAQLEGNSEELYVGDDEPEGEGTHYTISEQSADLLSRIRAKLEGDLEETMVSGTTAGDEAKPGVGGAKNNPTDVADALDLYLDSLLDAVLKASDMSEDDAMSMILDMADAGAEAGDLPPFPEEEASDDEVSLWLGKAKTVGFKRIVLDNV